MIKLWWPSIVVVTSICILYVPNDVYGQTVLMHAHNDYEQSEPLFNALRHDFFSIEIDIAREQETLRVSHDMDDLVSKPQLDKMYFKPLFNYLDTHPRKLILLIDLKSGGCLALLHQLVLRSSEYFHSKNDPNQVNPIKIVLSGRVDRESLAKAADYDYFFIDGRLADLGRGYSKELEPWISANFAKHVRFNDKGKLTRKSQSKIKSIVKSVHKEGKKIRFWNTQDTEYMWKVLKKLKVDIIGTDKVEQLHEFMSFNAAGKAG